MRVPALMVTIANAVDEDAGMLQGARIHGIRAHPVDDHGAGENLPLVNGFFPSGTGAHPSCTVNGERLDGVFEDCTHKDFYVWKGEVKEEFTPPTYNGRGSDAHWSTIPVNQTGGWQVGCVAYVKTEWATCNDWCEERGLICSKGMDDAHHQTAALSEWLGDAATDCSLSPLSAERKDQSDNGCNVKWETQVCACAVPAPPDPPELCSWPDNGQLINGAPPHLVQDCTGQHFHAYQGHVRGVAGVPSYPARVLASDDKWRTVMVSEEDTAFEGACVAYVKWGEDLNNDVGTCADWCTNAGMRCVGGMDDAHWQNHELTPWLESYGETETNCTLYPGGHHRQTDEDNGCQQSWHTHICACKRL